jgi:hypothetical protein
MTVDGDHRRIASPSALTALALSDPDDAAGAMPGVRLDAQTIKTRRQAPVEDLPAGQGD